MIGRRRFLRAAASAAVAAAAASGCATREASRDELPVYPPPPDAPRFRYLTALRAAGQMEADTTAKRLRDIAIGAPPPEREAMIKPYAVAAREGRIYVSDTIGRCIHVFDAPRRSFFRFGLRFQGRLQLPLAVATDAAGRVYVADGLRRAVIVFDALGLYQRTIGQAEELARPTGVAVSPDGQRIYVVDNGGPESDRHRLAIYGADGARLAQVGARGAEPGQFNVPTACAFGPDDRLYVLDAGNFRVQVFDAAGAALGAWGAIGNRPGQFARPRDIAVDRHGKVYVSDAAFGNVQLFTGAGQLLMSIGQFGATDAPGLFAMIAGVAADELGHVYAVDQVFRKVAVFGTINGVDSGIPQS